MLFRSVMPQVRRVAVLWDPEALGSRQQWDESQHPARALGLELYSMPASSVAGYETAFLEAAMAGIDAIWITLNPLANSNQKILADLAIKYRVPSICAREDYARNGCLLAYGPGYGAEGKDAARYVDKILKGTKPSEIPVEQPMIFELLLNQRTAEKMGIVFPPSVLIRTDRLVN